MATQSISLAATVSNWGLDPGHLGLNPDLLPGVFISAIGTLAMSQLTKSCVDNAPVGVGVCCGKGAVVV